MFYLDEPVGVPWSPPRGGEVQVAPGGDGHLRLLVAIASSPQVGEAHGAEPWNIFRIDFFPHFFCSPSNFLCGWQDILLRTLAVRNKGWDLQQYQDSSLSSVLLFSSQGQLKLIEQTGTFFHFQASFYTDISAYTFHTFTNRYLGLLQKRSRVLTPCLHNYTSKVSRLWPLIATLTSHSKFLLKSRALNMALQNIMHWL